MAPVLDAHDLWKSYRGGDGSTLHVLSGVDLAVNRGEMLPIEESTLLQTGVYRADGNR